MKSAYLIQVSALFSHLEKINNLSSFLKKFDNFLSHLKKMCPAVFSHNDLEKSLNTAQGEGHDNLGRSRSLKMYIIPKTDWLKTFKKKASKASYMVEGVTARKRM